MGIRVFLVALVGVLAGCGDKGQELPKDASLEQPFAAQKGGPSGGSSTIEDPMARHAEKSAREMKARYGN